jgi:hypothetical protein
MCSQIENRQECGRESYECQSFARALITQRAFPGPSDIAFRNAN